jgi:hypothetical protein
MTITRRGSRSPCNNMVAHKQLRWASAFRHSCLLRMSTRASKRSDQSSRSTWPAARRIDLQGNGMELQARWDMTSTSCPDQPMELKEQLIQRHAASSREVLQDQVRDRQVKKIYNKRPCDRLELKSSKLLLSTERSRGQWKRGSRKIRRELRWLLPDSFINCVWLNRISSNQGWVSFKRPFIWKESIISQ